ncbi:MAG: hypothetical protein ACKVP5_15465 [Aestuariivirga sp.]
MARASAASTVVFVSFKLAIVGLPFFRVATELGNTMQHQESTCEKKPTFTMIFATEGNRRKRQATHFQDYESGCHGFESCRARHFSGLRCHFS